MVHDDILWKDALEKERLWANAYSKFKRNIKKSKEYIDLQNEHKELLIKVKEIKKKMKVVAGYKANVELIKIHDDAKIAWKLHQENQNREYERARILRAIQGDANHGGVINTAHGGNEGW